MMPGRLRQPLRVAAFLGLAVAMPLLIAGAVTLDSAGLTVGALAFTAGVCALAMAAY
jgi:hypothetical protein